MLTFAFIDDASDFADESHVMDIAGAWSFSPCELEGYTPPVRSLGVLGRQSALLEQRN